MGSTLSDGGGSIPAVAGIKPGEVGKRLWKNAHNIRYNGHGLRLACVQRPRLLGQRSFGSEALIFTRERSPLVRSPPRLPCPQ